MSPQFAAGARVQVKNNRPETVMRLHLRTPHYVRGRQGIVLRALGRFPNPEDLAFNRPAPEKMLYHVLFEQQPVWNEGAAGDTLLVELFEHWLEPVEG